MSTRLSILGTRISRSSSVSFHRSFTRALYWVECEWWTPVEAPPACGTFFNLLLSFLVQSSLFFDPFFFVFFFHFIPIILRTSIDVCLLLFNPLPLFSSFLLLSTNAKIGILRRIDGCLFLPVLVKSAAGIIRESTKHTQNGTPQSSRSCSRSKLTLVYSTPRSVCAHV